MLSVGLVSVLILSGCAPKESASIVEKNIFGTVTNEASFAFEPTAANVFSNSQAVAFVEVKEIKEAALKIDSYSAETELVVSLLENHSDFKLENQFSIWNQGGSVKVEEFIAVLPERAEKMGLLDIAENQRNAQYVEFDADYYYPEIKVGDKILVALNVDEDGSLFVMMGGYSIFKEVENTSAQNDFKNVVSEEIVFI